MFTVAPPPGVGEQLLFVASQWAQPGTPAEMDRVLFRLTVMNDGPQPVRVYWDGPPPGYIAPATPPATVSEQSAVVDPGESTTVTGCRSVKVAWEPSAGKPATATGSYMVSWCCPPEWGAGTTADWGVPATFPPPPPVPAVNIFDPVDNVGPQVPVRFVLSNPTNEPCDIACEYSTDGGTTWQAASQAATSDARTTLPAPWLGADYRYIWNAAQDVGQVPAGALSAIFRVIPFSGGVSGMIGLSNPFSLGTTPNSAVQQPAVKQSVTVGSIVIDPASDAQTGISGTLLPRPLRAQILDQNQTPIAGARVTFAVQSPAQPPGGPATVTLERDPAGSTTTDVNGWVSICLRTSPGTTVPTGGGIVTVRVVGADPSLPGQFTFTVDQAKILTDPDNTQPLGIAYGSSQGIAVGLIGNSGTLYSVPPFQLEPARPMKLTVTGSSGLQVSHKEIQLPAPDGSYPVTLTVAVVDPPPAGSTVSAEQITLTSADPATKMAPVVIPVHPGALNTTTRTISFDPVNNTYGYEQVTPFMKPDPATLTTWPVTLVGYPGLTLKQQFRVQMTDLTGHPYTQQLTPGSPQSSALGAASPQGLMVNWSANGGSFSMQGGQPANPLPADVHQAVSYQPSGPGPWVINVTTNPQTVYDDLNNPSLPSDDYTLGGLSGTFTFIVQEATAAKFVVSGAKAGVAPYSKVVTGDIVTLEISGLSDISGGKPDQITLSSLNANLGQPGQDGPDQTAYSGLPFDFENKIDMTFSSGTLKSGAILFIPVDAQSPPAASCLQPVIRRGWLRAKADGFALHLPVDGPSASRRLVNGVESMQESPVGTSQTAGAAETVFVHNGEFCYGASDMSVTTRAGSVTLGRVFRGHLDYDGMLGPGWCFEHDSYLDVTSMSYNPLTQGYGRLQWVCSGRCDDLVYDTVNADFRPPPGFFVSIATSSSIDADTSAFKITDPHKRAIHFNPDGLLRFVKDRFGNITRYGWNEKSQLASITDPHGRTISFHYRPDGKLDSAEFLNRIVNYDYYPANASGQIFLKSATLPPAPTLLSNAAPGSAPNPVYRRSETYAYGNGQMTTVADSEGRVWLDMSAVGAYDGQNRVLSQIYGTAAQPFTFDYSAPLTTKITDRLQYETSFEFQRSPLPDGACATLNTDAAKKQWTFEYNLEGCLTHSVAPMGDETYYVYDDDPKKTQPVQRGNLLTVIRTNTSTGDFRAWSYQYDQTYNLVYRTVGPRGNAPGVNPEIYATHVLYDVYVTPSEQVADPDLVAGTQANAARVTRPRSLHMTIVPVASGARMNWVDAYQQDVYKYNSFGLCNWHRDPQGVVTRYTYYSDKTPTNGPDSPDGGGFLASETRDAENNWLRDSVFFTQAPAPDPVTTRWEYDDLGHISRITDNAGNVTTVTVSDLHELTQAVIPCGGGAGSQQPSVIQCSFAWDSDGRRAQSSLLQSNPDPAGGGASPYDHLTYDLLGNLQTVSSLRNSSMPPAQAKFGYDDNDLLLGAFPFDVQGAVCPLGGSGAQRDERGLSKTMLQGIPPGANPQALLQDTCAWNPNAEFDQLKEAGATGSYQVLKDGLGLPKGVVDPLLYAMNSARDEGGQPNRVTLEQGWTSAASGPAVACGQVRLNENGRAGRVHQNCFIASATPTPAPAAPEYMGPPQLWSPAVGTPVSSGLWGLPFGCVTNDSVSDAWNLPTRTVSDELGYKIVQRDTHGRPVDVQIWCGATPDASTLVRDSTYEYDAAGHSRLVTITDWPTSPGIPMTFATQLRHDPTGRLVLITDADGNTRRVEYDETGHVYVSFDPMGQQSGTDGNKTTFVRDGSGHITMTSTVLTVDGKGGSAQDTSSPFNPSGMVSFAMDYSADGRPLKNTDQTDTATFVTQWNYDSYGRLDHILYDDGSKFEYQYDPATGRKQTTTDANGNQVSFGYDDVRLRSVMCQGSGYTYDFDLGSVTISAAQSGGGSTFTKGRALQMFRDSRQHVVKEIQGTVTVGIDFSGVGKRVTSYPDNHGDVTWLHDNLGRLTSVLDRGVEVVSVVYSGPSRILTTTRCGLKTTCTYTGRVPRLTGIAITDANFGNEIVRYSIARDALNRITSRTRTAAGIGETKLWTYDSAGRITHEVFTPAPVRSPGPLNTDLMFDGDSVLRKLTRDEVRGGAVVPKATVIHQTRGERGRVLTRDAVTLQYDNNGNLKNDGIQTYTWDGFNRLTGVTAANGHAIVFDYDGLNRVISRTDTTSGAAEEYVYDGWNLIEVRDPAASGAVKERYVYGGQMDDLVSVEQSGKRFVFLYTPEGYIDALVDSGNNIVERYDYDLFGNVTVLNPAGVPQPNAVPQSRVLFQRRPYDPVTGLYDQRERRYLPVLGIFLSPDPSGFTQGPNHYSFCHGDPVNSHDPFGREQTWSQWWDEKKAEAAAAASGFAEGWVDGEYIVANAFTAGQITSLSKEANARASQYGTAGTVMKVTAGIGAGAAYLAGGLVLAEAAGVTTIGSTSVSALPSALSSGATSLANTAAQAVTRAYGAAATRAAALTPLAARALYETNRFCDWLNNLWERLPGKVRGGLEAGSELAGLPLTPQGLLDMSGASSRRAGMRGAVIQFQHEGETDSEVLQGSNNALRALEGEELSNWENPLQLPKFKGGSNVAVVHGPGVKGVVEGRATSPTPFRTGTRRISTAEVGQKMVASPHRDNDLPTVMASCGVAGDRRVAQQLANALVRGGAKDPRLRAATTIVSPDNFSLSNDANGKPGKWVTYLGIREEP